MRTNEWLRIGTLASASMLAVASASFGQCGSTNDCCAPGIGPGCSDVACCETVCAVDSYCCAVAWDSLCATEAISMCDPSACGGGGVPCPNPEHDCFTTGNPGCADEECCNAVCAIDSFCCQVSWDGICVGEAQSLCGTGPCPNPEHDCFTTGNPGCADEECCNSVCAIDSFCCQVSWDEICVGEAQQLCAENVCGTSTNDCCAPASTPGCSDEACCTIVCAVDPFCCEVAWDGICAAEAFDLCMICELDLYLDIKPGSCPNPFNPKANGYLPVSVLGTADFDVYMIDVQSILISRADGVGGSVAPNFGPGGPSPKYGDSGTPYEGGDACGCHEFEGDGFMDLKLNFSRSDMTAMLELSGVPGGTFVELVVSGMLVDGTPFTAKDCVKLVPNASSPPSPKAGGAVAD